MPALIALLMQALTWLVSTYAGQWVLKILVSLGVGITVQKVAMPELLGFVQQQLSSLDPFYIQAFGAMGGDVAITMILSAIAARVTGKMALKAVST